MYIKAKHINIIIRYIIFFISVVFIGAAVVDYGFVLDAHEMEYVHQVYNCSWWCYFLLFNIQLGFRYKEINRKTFTLTFLLGIALYLSAIPRFMVMPPDATAWVKTVWQVLTNKYYTVSVLGIFAILEISRGVINFINKKTNPALLLAVGFAIIIFFGALLLLLPRSTHEHIRLTLADALFVSTSAVCVTGLSTVDIASTFSIEGQIIIALLIQIGGLGVMTITSFFALFFMGNTGLYNQFALRHMIGSDTFSSLLSTLISILGFTFIIELSGAFLIWTNIHATMGMTIHEEIFFSLFHAVSAFCNAGFSTLSGNLGNPLLMNGHNGFYLVISLLIVLGGIGFPLLVNLKQVANYYLTGFIRRLSDKQYHQPRYTHLTNINTRIVGRMTLGLIIGGTLLMALLEWNGAWTGMSNTDKLVQSLFNAVATRTAGFNSVDLTRFSLLTLIVYTFLMWIGGASQSTAGGIKVNTFAVTVANLLSVVRGSKSVTLFNREIPADSVRRASATILGSIITMLFFFMALVALEPDLSPRGLFFETVSAYCTVGASLNITPQLGEASKVTVSVLMFIGRVGFITILMSIIPPKETPPYRFPQDNVIIN